jgi:hypothetical protein
MAPGMIQLVFLYFEKAEHLILSQKVFVYLRT